MCAYVYLNSSYVHLLIAISIFNYVLEKSCIYRSNVQLPRFRCLKIDHCLTLSVTAI